MDKQDLVQELDLDRVLEPPQQHTPNQVQLPMAKAEQVLMDRLGQAFQEVDMDNQVHHHRINHRHHTNLDMDSREHTGRQEQVDSRVEHHINHQRVDKQAGRQVDKASSQKHQEQGHPPDQDQVTLSRQRKFDLR